MSEPWVLGVGVVELAIILVMLVLVASLIAGVVAVAWFVGGGHR